jgi:hypothetical protein
MFYPLGVKFCQTIFYFLFNRRHFIHSKIKGSFKSKCGCSDLKKISFFLESRTTKILSYDINQLNSSHFEGKKKAQSFHSPERRNVRKKE